VFSRAFVDLKKRKYLEIIKQYPRIWHLSAACALLKCATPSSNVMEIHQEVANAEKMSGTPNESMILHTLHEFSPVVSISSMGQITYSGKRWVYIQNRMLGAPDYNYGVIRLPGSPSSTDPKVLPFPLPPTMHSLFRAVDPSLQFAISKEATKPSAHIMQIFKSSKWSEQYIESTAESLLSEVMLTMLYFETILFMSEELGI
jgi:hypothetical protein